MNNIKILLSFVIIVALSPGMSSGADEDLAGHTLPQNRIIPDISALRQVNITEALSDRLSALFGGRSGRVQSIMNNPNVILNTDERTLSPEELEELSQRNEQVMLVLPGVTVSEEGIYVLGIDLEGRAEPGALINTLSTTRSISAAAYDSHFSGPLDEEGNPLQTYTAPNGNEYYIIPQNRYFIAALDLQPGDSWQGIIASPSGLQVVEIEPVAPEELTDDTIDNLVQAIEEMLQRPEVIENIINRNILSRDILSRDIVSADINYLSEAYITPPQEPTPAMEQAVRDEGYNIAAKLNTIRVPESGFYVVKITIPEDTFSDLDGTAVGRVRVFALNDTEAGSSGLEVRSSIINGIVNTFELLSLSGEKIEQIGARELLMIGLLEAGESFSVYLAKILIALLMGGCNQGMGLLYLASAVMVFVLLRRRRKL